MKKYYIIVMAISLILLCSAKNIYLPELGNKKLTRTIKITSDISTLSSKNSLTLCSFDLIWLSNDSLLVVQNPDPAFFLTSQYPNYPEYLLADNSMLSQTQYILITESSQSSTLLTDTSPLYERVRKDVKEFYKNHYNYQLQKSESVIKTRVIPAKPAMTDFGGFSPAAVSTMLMSGGSVVINGQRITKEDLVSKPASFIDYVSHYQREFTKTISLNDQTSYDIKLEYQESDRSFYPDSFTRQWFPKYTGTTKFSGFYPKSSTISILRNNPSVNDIIPSPITACLFDSSSENAKINPANVPKGTWPSIYDIGRFTPLSLKSSIGKTKEHQSICLFTPFPRINISQDGRYLLVDDRLHNLSDGSVVAEHIIGKSYMSCAVSPDWTKFAYIELSRYDMKELSNNGRYKVKITKLALP